jgi:hypothetical protein
MPAAPNAAWSSAALAVLAFTLVVAGAEAAVEGALEGGLESVTAGLATGEAAVGTNDAPAPLHAAIVTTTKRESGARPWIRCMTFL